MPRATPQKAPQKTRRSRSLSTPLVLANDLQPGAKHGPRVTTILPSEEVIIPALRRLRSEQQRVFCLALARYGTLTHACIESGISIDRANSLRRDNDDFKEAWDQAQTISVDVLEHTARGRAVDGVQRPMVVSGHVVHYADGTPVMLTEYSDRMLELLLKGRRKDVFGDTVKHTGDPLSPILIKVGSSDSAL